MLAGSNAKLLIVRVVVATGPGLVCPARGDRESEPPQPDSTTATQARTAMAGLLTPTRMGEPFRRG
jgi:hypothetical protein